MYDSGRAFVNQQPRVHDKRTDEDGRRMRFSSTILPPYLRRTRSIDELIPWLYLKGVSTGDFTDALTALLGPQTPGLSATNIVRLKACWQQEWTACLTMVFKLAQCAEKHWRRLNGKELLPEVIRGIRFVEGVKEIAA